MNIVKEGLVGKSVMTNEGEFIGRINGFLLDKSKRKINSIKVQPEFDSNQKDKSKKNNDEYNIPSSSCISVKDIIIIEKE